MLTLLTLFIVSACSTSDDVLEDSLPTHETVEEAIKSVYTNWGANRASVIQYMKGYKQIDNSDLSILEFKASKLPLTVAYRFANDQLCAAAVLSPVSNDDFDTNQILKNYSYIGESDNKDIFSNEQNNIFAVSYLNRNYEDIDTCVIGFTPLHAMTSKIDGQEYADLGLSVKWAVKNVGAQNKEDYGNYYAFGETKEKETYNWKTYMYCSGTSSSCINLGDSICGTNYDVAFQSMGESWQMPTKKECDELRTKCSWVWTISDGVSGYKVFGKNGNYIFLPAGGYKYTSLKYNGTEGFYWTSTQYGKNIYSAYNLKFTSSKRLTDYNNRYYGGNIRGVCK